MPFGVDLRWTRTAFVQREQKQASLPPPDRAQYQASLTETIMAWAQMTMSSMSPGPNPSGSALVAYRASTPSTDRTLQTSWTCNLRHWSPEGVALDVASIS